MAKDGRFWRHLSGQSPDNGRRRPERRRTDREPNRGWVPALSIGVAIALLDWCLKAAIIANLAIGDFVEIWDNRVALWHVRNDAMILGLYGDLPLDYRRAIAILAAVLGALLLFEVIGRGHRLPPRRRPWAWSFVGLVFRGMLGNLGERAIHWGVTDYLSFRVGDIWLPPGNIADLALFLAIPLSAVVMVFEVRARSRRGVGAAGSQGERGGAR